MKPERAGAGGLTTRAKRTGGMTLVEVLVAMVVLGVGLTAVMEGFASCSRATGMIGYETAARTAAAAMLAEVRENPELMVSGDAGTLAPEYPNLRWKRTLRESGEEGVLAVEIRVEWRTQGVARGVALATMVRSPKF